jgi:hypothetical protein
MYATEKGKVGTRSRWAIGEVELVGISFKKKINSLEATHFT